MEKELAPEFKNFGFKVKSLPECRPQDFCGGFQMLTKAYKGLQSLTKAYKGLQRLPKTTGLGFRV